MTNRTGPLGCVYRARHNPPTSSPEVVWDPEVREVFGNQSSLYIRDITSAISINQQQRQKQKPGRERPYETDDGFRLGSAQKPVDWNLDRRARARDYIPAHNTIPAIPRRSKEYIPGTRRERFSLRFSRVESRSEKERDRTLSALARLADSTRNALIPTESASSRPC